MIVKLFYKSISLIAFVACGYALFHYGVSDINSQALWDSRGEKRAPLLAYQNDQERLSSASLMVKAWLSSGESPDDSEAYALAALKQDPSSGRAATHLLSLYGASGRYQESDQIAEIASRLWPAHQYTRSHLVDYWLRRDRADKFVQEASVLLVRNGGAKSKLYPTFKKMLESDELSSHIFAIAANPPSWWDSFFSYIAKDVSLPILERLFRSRVASGITLSDSERTNYVNRLIKEKQWAEAHDTWFLGLKPRQMRYSGLVYDGGFESGVINQGFGWSFRRSKNPRIKTDITYGIKGRKALQLTFRKQQPVNFNLVSQYLMLEQGEYELSVRFRADSLKSTKGLVWQLSCVDDAADLMVSNPMLDTRPWSKLQMEFSVPSSCDIQLLRLISSSKFRHDQYHEGNLWFDDVVIRSLKHSGG